MTAKKIIIKVTKKYPETLTSYKRLIIYCFLEQGYNFPLSIEAVMNCKSTETIRRTFQELKRDGVIKVPDWKQREWNSNAQEIHDYYAKKDIYGRDNVTGERVLLNP